MLITFVRGGRRATVATIRRHDGVVLELPSFDRKYRVPHDLAHAVTERELGLAGGVFGSIAGGGVFGNMRVLAGRPRHDAADRSRRLLAANKQEIDAAELLAAAVHDAVEHGRPSAAEPRARRAWAAFRTDPFPWDSAAVTAAVDRLTALTTEFEETGELSFTWPDRLTSRVPEPAVTRRGRRGRL